MRPVCIILYFTLILWLSAATCYADKDEGDGTIDDKKHVTQKAPEKASKEISIKRKINVKAGSKPYKKAKKEKSKSIN